MNVTQNNVPVPSSSRESDPELKWEGHMADDVGATYGHTPMAALTATSDLLILAGTRGNFRVPRNAITKIGRGKMYPWLFSAVRIHHNVRGYPADLQFKPLGVHPRDVIAQLRQLGYPLA
jgi:hypothetical protein